MGKVGSGKRNPIPALPATAAFLIFLVFLALFITVSPLIKPCFSSLVSQLSQNAITCFFPAIAKKKLFAGMLSCRIWFMRIRPGDVPGRNALPSFRQSMRDTGLECQPLEDSMITAVIMLCSLYAMVSQVPGSPRGFLIKTLTTSRDKE